MNTKRKGNIGEAKAIAEFVSAGITVCIPFGDNEVYDFVIEVNHIFKKVQVKTIQNPKENGSVELKLTSRRYGVDHNYAKSEIDIFVLYCVDLDTCYFVDFSKVTNRRSFTISINNSDLYSIKILLDK
jgi:hypothetical protein